jgi:hypothetical protein
VDPSRTSAATGAPTGGSGTAKIDLDGIIIGVDTHPLDEPGNVDVPASLSQTAALQDQVEHYAFCAPASAELSHV